MTAPLLTLVIATTLAILLLAMKHHGDRILNEILASEEREIERWRQAGIQSGFAAGWHGGGRR